MAKSRYTDDDLKTAIQKSSTFRQVLVLLGMYPKGGNYKQLKNRLARCPEITTDHLLGKGHGTSVPPSKRPLSDLLIEGSQINSDKLKRRLIREGLLNEVCENGHPVEWMGRRLSLHLDHINGVNTDNRIENLRLLCPNCHSLPETYCRGTRRKKTAACADCGKSITPGYERCGPCGAKNVGDARHKITWPPVETVVKMVSETSYLAAGRALGVRDNSIRKYLKRHGFDPVAVRSGKTS